MNKRFAELVDALESKYRSLLAIRAVKYDALPREMPSRGIYLFSEGALRLYVGRTNRLRQRLQSHCRPSGTHYTATLAFRMARHKTGKVKATYTAEGSRDALTNDPRFVRAFRAAKRRVRAMDIRFVEEEEPTRQALLEIYVATVLKTRFNDFDTH
ncbi:MAG: GIY-YIG nuclease family protein [bacterium]